MQIDETVHGCPVAVVHLIVRVEILVLQVKSGHLGATAFGCGHRPRYDIYARLENWGYGHKTVCHAHGEYARDDDGDGFCEVHLNTIEGFWSLLRSWLRPHHGISQNKL